MQEWFGHVSIKVLYHEMFWASITESSFQIHPISGTNKFNSSLWNIIKITTLAARIWYIDVLSHCALYFIHVVLWAAYFTTAQKNRAQWHLRFSLVAWVLLPCLTLFDVEGDRGELAAWHRNNQADYHVAILLLTIFFSDVIRVTGDFALCLHLLQ